MTRVIRLEARQMKKSQNLIPNKLDTE
jgi:hypothetical protein